MPYTTGLPALTAAGGTYATVGPVWQLRGRMQRGAARAHILHLNDVFIRRMQWQRIDPHGITFLLDLDALQ